MQERRDQTAIIKRIEGLENGHQALQNSIQLNTKITNDGFAELSEKIDSMTEMFEHYKAAKYGGLFLTKLGALIIAIGGAWTVMKDRF